MIKQLTESELPSALDVIHRSFGSCCKGIKSYKRKLSDGFVHTGTKKFNHLPFAAGFMEWSDNQ